MRACTTASGGVMFIEDEIKTKSGSVSYRELAKEKSANTNIKTFGKRKTETSIKKQTA